MPRTPERRLRAWAAWLLCTTLFVLFALLPALRAGGRNLISDSLYLGELYRDVFVNRVGFAGWNLQPAPSLFPDAPVFFLLRAMVGRSDLALQAYAAVATTAVALLAADLARQAGASPWKSRFAAMAVASALANAALHERGFLCAIHPSCHGASLIVGMGVAALAVRELRSDRPRFGRLASITLLAMATAAFDRIFLLYSGIPLLASVTFCAMFGLARFGRCARVAVAIGVGLGCALAGLGDRIVKALGATLAPVWWASPKQELAVSWGALGDTFKMIGAYEWHPVVMPLCLGALVVTIVGSTAVVTDAAWAWARARARSSGPSAHHAAVRTFLAMAALLSMAATMTGIVAENALRSKWEIRYLLPALVLPCVALPLLLTLALQARTRLLVLAVASLSAAAALVHVRHDEVSLAAAPEPPEQTRRAVACVDRLAATYDARYGYATYFNARKFSELSSLHIRLSSISNNLGPNVWISNRRYYREGLLGAQHFLVLTEGIDEQALRARFGEPLEVVKCPGAPSAWVYAGPPRSPIFP